MGLLDDEYVPPWTPPKPKRYQKQTALTQQERDAELNNHDREEVTEDYTDIRKMHDGNRDA